MNGKFVCRIAALSVFVSSLFMIVPAGIAFFDGQMFNAAVYLGVTGLMMLFSLITLIVTRNYKPEIYAQEGFASTSISWILISLFGALPFWLSGEIPNFIDALFENVSGFTTTGASILTDVEALSRCHIYWRSFTHWLGGMGMLVFLLAVIPLARKESGSAIFLMKAESPGPVVGKFTPHLRETALILYSIYILLTVACCVFLLIGNMSFFDALCISFGTAGTGGFGITNLSMGSYSPYLQGVVTVFMFLFGINFNLYFLLILRQFKSVLKDVELRAYVLIAVSAVALISLNIYKLYGSIIESVHHAAFQVSSIMTTTGYSTVDFDQWPAFSKSILMILMICGAMAGSTGGGLKVSRLIILAKTIWQSIIKALRPRKVHVVRMNGRVISEATCNSVNSYFAIYCFIIVISFVIISVDGFSIGTNVSAVLACFNNIGPGFESVGPTCNFSSYSVLSKFILICDMILGRLEIFPIMALFSPDLWSRKR